MRLLVWSTRKEARRGSRKKTMSENTREGKVCVKMYFLPPHPGGKGSTSVVVVVCPTFSPGLVLCNLGTTTDWSFHALESGSGEKVGRSQFTLEP